MVRGLTNSPDFSATRPACAREKNYFLPFLVVFFAEDFLVVAFFFLAAMALGTSFLAGTVKLEKFFVNDFLLASKFFFALRPSAIFRLLARRARSRDENRTATATLSKARRQRGEDEIN